MNSKEKITKKSYEALRMKKRSVYNRNNQPKRQKIFFLGKNEIKN